MAVFRLRWRYFLSRRSAARLSMAAGLSLLVALLVALAMVPADDRALVLAWLASVAQVTGVLSSEQLLGAGLIVCGVLIFAALFAPGARKHGYLAAAPALIPPVSVYLDAENQLPANAIRPFVSFLMEHLDGRRADLLYFLDASEPSLQSKYTELYRFGFRPVDVPHNPTGDHILKEAVDKELAMHAYERALLGPPHQEFIIVTGDQDFVHLVYRLVALGHRVQIWAAPMRQAYRTLGTYLDVELLDLTQVISELEVARREHVPPQAPGRAPGSAGSGAARAAKGARSDAVSAASTHPPSASTDPTTGTLDVLELSGERAFYRAIAGTLRAYEKAFRRTRGRAAENALRSLLAGDLKAQLAQVGYSAGSRLDYWIEHLIAAGVFAREAGSGSLKVITTEPDLAASRLFGMTKAAARCAARVAATHEHGAVRMDEVAAELIASGSATLSADADALYQLLVTSGTRRGMHARYWVRGARSLGLLDFEDTPASLDTVRYVSLVSPADDQPPGDGAPTQPPDGSGPADAPDAPAAG